MKNRNNNPMKVPLAGKTVNRLGHHVSITFARQWLVAVLLVISAATAQAQTTITLVATNLFGGAGDQRATAVSIANGALYFSGVTSANGNDGLVVRHALPMSNAAAPVWSALWPGLTGNDDFGGVSASTEGVYVAGGSFNRTTDNIGGKENKGITVKFPLTGATGGGFGGAIWDQQTPVSGTFPYGGGEGLNASFVSVESGTPFIYVTGNGQANGGNGGRFFLSKLTTNNAVLWTRDDSASMVNNAYSLGRGITALDGNIYVSGANTDNGSQAYLRKYDANGNFIWARTTSAGSYIGVTTFGGAIFAVGQTSFGVNANFLVDKWDEAGNLVWSQQSDRGNAEDYLTSIVPLGGRLYAAGATRGSTAGGADSAVLEIDPVTGNLLSTTLYGGEQDDFGNGIATDGVGLYVVGETRSFVAGGNGAGQNDAFVLRYSVTPSLTSLAISPLNQTIGVGTNQLFTATGTFSDGSSRTLISGAGVWATKAAIPTASYALGGAFAGGKFYAISGFATARLGIYNPQNDTWTTGTPLPADTGFNLRQYSGVTVESGKIYVVGGDTGGSGDRATLLRYDPAFDTWTNLAPMPLGARFSLGAAALNGKIYAVGGTTVASGSPLSRVEEYNPSNNTWTTKASMPTARSGALVGAINGKLIVAGGSDALGATNVTESYDPATDTWTTKAPMPVSGAGDSAVLNGKLFSIGGITAGQQIVLSYDAALNLWNTNYALMPTGRRVIGVAADEFNNKIYAAAGYFNSTLSTLEVFTAPEVSWSSSDPTVASLTTGGLATGLSIGVSTITATTAVGNTNTPLTVVGQPGISVQPMNATAGANGSVTLSVTASGGGLSYQWRLNGNDLFGENASALNLNNLNALQAGVYSVVVSNAAGTITSSPATLSLVSLNMFAGLTVVGQVGGTYQIDYRNDMNNTNWLNLTNIVLPSSPYLYIDTDSPQHPQRFYRAVLVP